MSASRTIIKVAINSLIGLVLIIIWLQFVDVNEIFKLVSRVNFSLLLGIAVSMLLSISIRALRLKIILSGVIKIPLQDLIFLNGVSGMLNFLIPIRAGEIIKGVYLNKRYQIHLGKSFIWIFLDRFLDLLAVLVLIPPLLLIIPTSLSINFIKIITVILAATLSLSYLAIYKPYFALKISKFLSIFLIFDSIKKYFDTFFNFLLESFVVLKREPKEFLLISFLTVFSYVADCLTWYFAFLSLSAPQDFLKLYLAQLLSALTYLIPAAPGYVGSAEASGLLIFSGVFNIEPNLASAAIVLFHLVAAVFIICFGTLSLYSLKLELGDLLKKAFKWKPSLP